MVNYFSFHLQDKSINNKDVLFLINSGLLTCYQNYPDSTLDEKFQPHAPTLTLEEGDDTYEVVPVGLQMIINPNLSFYYNEEIKENIYECSANEESYFCGNFESLNEKFIVPKLFRQEFVCISHVIAENTVYGSTSSKLNNFKVKLEEIKDTIDKIRDDDYICNPHHDLLQSDYLTNEQREYVREIRKGKKKKLNQDPPPSVYAVTGALIELLKAKGKAYHTDSSIKIDLEDKKMKGFSEGNLNSIFSKANDTLEYYKNLKKSEDNS